MHMKLSNNVLWAITFYYIPIQMTWVKGQGHRVHCKGQIVVKIIIIADIISIITCRYIILDKEVVFVIIYNACLPK